MPTVILQGGLGNQLFQYAVGRSLSLRTGSTLYLETSNFSRSTDSNLPQRTFHLPNFAIRGETIQKPIEQAPLLKGRFKLFNLLSRVTPKLATRICRVHRDLKNPHCFTPHVLNVPKNSVLYGYYQSEKYFSRIRKMLREELSLRSKPSGRNRKWKAQIEEKRSISVHVRRGDYTDQGWTLPNEYYRLAIKSIDHIDENTHLFFFSDEMEWVKENIKLILPEGLSSGKVSYVNCNDNRNAYEDIRLMRLCTHNVIANSTFSWWGAWLNPNKEKSVLAPSYWLRNRVENLDIIPKRWRIIDW